MIIGIGSDLSNIERIANSIERYGERFLKKAFTAAEVSEMEGRKKVSAHRMACAAAKRFACKEACSKALGTGFRKGVYLKDIEVIHQPSGKPVMTLYNGALKRLHDIAGENAQVHVTMTDDYPWASAFVVIESL